MRELLKRGISNWGSSLKGEIMGESLKGGITYSSHLLKAELLKGGISKRGDY